MNLINFSVNQQAEVVSFIIGEPKKEELQWSAQVSLGRVKKFAAAHSLDDGPDFWSREFPRYADLFATSEIRIGEMVPLRAV